MNATQLKVEILTMTQQYELMKRTDTTPFGELEEMKIKIACLNELYVKYF